MDSRQYWAQAPRAEIAYNMQDRIDAYYEYLSMSGRLDLYRRSYSYYYRSRMTGGRMNPVGQQGELTAININHYRNFLVHLETMTTQQRAAFEPRATNSDVKSQSQTILAAGLLDYYMREKKLERAIKQAVKDGLMFDEGFVDASWDPTAGKTYGISPNGAPVYEGDMKYTNYTALGCIRDFTKISPSDQDWYILRDFENKFNLAAKYPAQADQILDDTIDQLEVARTTLLDILVLEDSDNIPTYTLKHKPTPALPQGRLTKILENGTVLLDGPLPYKEAHVYRVAPDEQSGSIFGYTVGYDLLVVQETVDMLYSTAATNIATFGVQNVLTPKGHDLSVEQLTGGLNLMEYDPKIGKPEALNLTATPAEVYNFMQMLERLGETISGVNSVARGNPEASLKSGAALALVQSMAIQFSMTLQQSYAALVEDLGTGTIQILQSFATVPRVAEIAGKSNRPLMKEFVGSDLDMISRVTVDLGNPLTRTTAGKVNLAEALADRNLIENADQYIQVVTTGRLEPVIQGKQAQLLLIKGENEKLAEGQPQRAIITDNHQKHILEHTTVLANPEIRQDPNNPIMQQTLAHIQEHITMMGNPMVQQLAAILHYENVAPPQLPPPPGGPGPGQMMNAAPPVVQQAQGVKQPSMPKPPAGTDAQSAEVIQGQAQ